MFFHVSDSFASRSIHFEGALTSSSLWFFFGQFWWERLLPEGPMSTWLAGMQYLWFLGKHSGDPSMQPC